jgi:hypothetical protein
LGVGWRVQVPLAYLDLSSIVLSRFPPSGNCSPSLEGVLDVVVAKAPRLGSGERSSAALSPWRVHRQRRYACPHLCLLGRAGCGLRSARLPRFPEACQPPCEGVFDDLGINRSQAVLGGQAASTVRPATTEARVAVRWVR